MQRVCIYMSLRKYVASLVISEGRPTMHKTFPLPLFKASPDRSFEQRQSSDRVIEDGR